VDYSKPNDSYTAHDILVIVAEKFGVECRYLLTSAIPRSGAKRAATAKCFACLLIKRNTNTTLEEVGRLVCLYTPKEVLEACKTAMAMVMANVEDALIFKEIEGILRWQRPLPVMPTSRQRSSTC